jgi:hypothetical protein
MSDPTPLAAPSQVPGVSATPAAPGAANSNPNGSELAQRYRLRKSDGGEIYGPIDGATLKEWADSAQVAPGDQYDREDNNWQPVTDLEFLLMFYKVKLNDGTEYGPTTVGTLREFLNEGIVTEDTKVHHLQRHTSMPLAALLAQIDFKPRSGGDSTESPKPIAEDADSLALLSNHPAIELAKDQHIRQLEEDLRQVKRKYEELLQKYRQLNQELVATRNK